MLQVFLIQLLTLSFIWFNTSAYAAFWKFVYSWPSEKQQLFEGNTEERTSAEWIAATTWNRHRLSLFWWNCYCTVREYLASSLHETRLLHFSYYSHSKLKILKLTFIFADCSSFKKRWSVTPTFRCIICSRYLLIWTALVQFTRFPVYKVWALSDRQYPFVGVKYKGKPKRF